MNVLELDGVTKVYGAGRLEVLAVDDVTLTVREGELVIVMGPSGSGKTTMLQLMGALLTPTSGEVRIRGRALGSAGSSALARIRLTEIGFIFQAFNLFGALDARDNVSLPLRLAGWSRRTASLRAETLLGELGLGNRLDHLPEELSGGEKQRVAVARALASDPPLILADEPTGNLDSASGYQVLHLLKGIARAEGKTVVVVTHDHRITDAADRVLWLEDGRLRDREASFATTVDPVCGMEIVTERAAAHRKVGRRTYSFCSQLCTDTFDADTDAYVAASRGGRRSRTPARSGTTSRGKPRKSRPAPKRKPAAKRKGRTRGSGASGAGSRGRLRR